MQKIAVLGLLTTMLVLNACSSSGSSGGSSHSDSTQAAAIQSGASALESLGSTASFTFTSSSVKPNSQETDSICNDDGTPKATADSSEWAFHKYLCAGAHNTNSPDSALGALYLNKGIICMADLNGLTYSASGTAITLTDVAFTTTCFSQDMIDAFATDGITKVSATITGYSMDATTGWDYKVTMTGSSDIDDFELYVRSSGNVTAAAFKSASEGWSFNVDRRNATNALIYESIGQNLHIRIMAEGSISTDGEVNSVTGMAGIVAEASGGDFVSLRGSESDGLRLKWKKAPNAAQDGGACADIFSSGGTCGSTTALTFASGSVTNFTNAGAQTTAIALYDDNPIFMTVSGFVETPSPAGLVGSTLR